MAYSVNELIRRYAGWHMDRTNGTSETRLIQRIAEVVLVFRSDLAGEVVG